MILVSSCLLGINCKYNGKNNYSEKLEQILKTEEVLPLCAEQLGGLTTPRSPAEIKNINGEKRVINKNGEDVTENFLRGAEEVLKMVKKFNIKKAILKDKSPSCGKGKVYSGNFDGNLVDGNGILTDLLIKNGVEVITINEI